MISISEGLKMWILLIYVVTLAFLSLNPWVMPDPHQVVGIIAWDKIDHVVAYCLLSLLLMLIYKFPKSLGCASFMVLLTSSLLGILFEYCQNWFTTTRQFSYQDATANVFGAFFGVALYWCYRLLAVKRLKHLD
jgi:VanZ family protein